MDAKIRHEALAAVLNSVGLSRSQRMPKESEQIHPMWAGIEMADNVPRPYVAPKAPAKVLPFVNHNARYKKLKRQAAAK